MSQTTLLFYASGESANSLQRNLYLGDPAFQLRDGVPVMIGEATWIMINVDGPFMRTSFINGLSPVQDLFVWNDFLTPAIIERIRAVTLNTELTNSLVSLNFIYRE